MWRNGPGEDGRRGTHAVYSNDYDGAVSHFDDAIRGSVTRTQLGDLSDRMHALGDYTAIAPRNADPASRKYEYDATFAHGTMLVELRLDADGKVAAYRIAAEPAPSAKAR